MTIRRAAERDIDRILALLHQVNDVHAAGRPDLFIMGQTKYDAAELKLLIYKETTPIFVETDDADQVMGYAFCQIVESDGSANMQPQKELYIDDICFDEQYRGQGAAKPLYDAVIAYAKEIGCDRATLHVWECNPRAKRFYEKCGMEPYFYAMETRLK